MTNFRAPDDMDECIAGIAKVIEKASMIRRGASWIRVATHSPSDLFAQLRE